MHYKLLALDLDGTALSIPILLRPGWQKLRPRPPRQAALWLWPPAAPADACLPT